MVFIRPRVLRTAEQAAIETNAKYNYLRDMQIERNDGKVRMMPGATQPTLPPLVGPTQPTPTPPPPAPLKWRPRHRTIRLRTRRPPARAAASEPSRLPPPRRSDR